MATQDHSRFTPEHYREVDAELAAAEQEMADVDAELAAWHEKQAERKKRGVRFG